MPATAHFSCPTLRQPHFKYRDSHLRLWRTTLALALALAFLVQPHLATAADINLDFYPYSITAATASATSTSASTSTSAEANSTCITPSSLPPCTTSMRELPLIVLGVLLSVLGIELWCWGIYTLYRQGRIVSTTPGDGDTGGFRGYWRRSGLNSNMAASWGKSAERQQGRKSRFRELL